MKSPTNEEKIEMYENFLHKINMCCVSMNNNAIKELVENADIWSYNHRRGNGELSDDEQQKLIDGAFWKLCDTPRSDLEREEMRKAYAKHSKNNSNT